MIDDIKVGDKVEFETSSVPPCNTPRWQFNDDTGGNGVYAFGEVFYVDSKIIKVKYEIEGFAGTGECHWPNYDHEDYLPWQWCESGYLCVIERPELHCECGAEKVYGVNTFHSDWCPKYK